MTRSKKVFVHIVTYNSERFIRRCLEAVLSQSGYNTEDNLRILVTDNASSDCGAEICAEFAAQGVTVVQNRDNLGFCGGHNQGIFEFLQSGCDYFLCLNPDLVLSPDALSVMSGALDGADPGIGAVCPKLLRADDNLDRIEPPVIDAAGMYFTPSLRHFDRGSGEQDRGQYDRQCLVAGGSGACLLMRRELIESLVTVSPFESDVDRLYPALAAGRERRTLLFDEGFFAYREDADLAWRALILGWKCLYVPHAVGFHRRLVTSENRASLPEILNLLGVRNRFLLQINNYSLSYGPAVFFSGFLIRNWLVCAAVLVKERESLRAFPGVMKLLRRGLSRRRMINKRRIVPDRELRKWFSAKPYTEEK